MNIRSCLPPPMVGGWVSVVGASTVGAWFSMAAMVDEYNNGVRNGDK